MKIKLNRKKCVTYSIVLIFVGILISTIGFGTTNFSLNKLRQNNIGNSWYQTIHIEEDNIWYGVNFGNTIHIISIGNAD